MDSCGLRVQKHRASAVSANADPMSSTNTNASPSKVGSSSGSSSSSSSSIMITSPTKVGSSHQTGFRVRFDLQHIGSVEQIRNVLIGTGCL